MKFIIILLLIACCIWSVQAQDPILYLETQGERKLNIKYKSTPEKDLYLDIYYPSKQTENKTYPVLVYVHGGGWFNGSKENITKGLFKETFQNLVEQGFAVVPINYRLTRHKSVVMRDCVVDVMDAVRYLSKNNSNLGFDSNRVFVLGDSAGGQLAQMLTLANPSAFPGDSALCNYKYKMIAGVSWYGPSDFTRMELFATDDPTKEADSIGAPVELFIAKNAGHNWRNVNGEIDPSKDVIIQKTIDFFIKKITQN